MSYTTSYTPAFTTCHAAPYARTLRPRTTPADGPPTVRGPECSNFHAMASSPIAPHPGTAAHAPNDVAAALAAAVADVAARYEADGNVAALHRGIARALDAAAADWPTSTAATPATPTARAAAVLVGAVGGAVGGAPVTLADAVVAAARPYEQVPEIAGPLYERVVALRPDDARALVVLGNAYWLHGRGPDVVGDLAARALAADPANRGAWHLWALTEADPRQRMLRWQQVTVRFPGDDLARALFADAAASVAGAEHDDEALVLAVAAYEDLLARTDRPEQRAALEGALTTLRAWKL